MLGATVGSYRITSRIGEGGMGAVYLGEHTLLGRTAAIKVLHPELSHQPDIVERFFNEARSASAIRHPGIVEIFDFGYAEDDAAYIVMEHLAGESLRNRLDHALALDPQRAASIGRQIASALQGAHDQEIIHRDLKPDNIFLVPDQEVAGGERAKILDFGIAKLAAGSGASFRTQTGQLFGTPGYMAPEQCRGAGNIDHRSDLYALGCIMYEMVCGRPPFVGEGGGEVLAAQIYEEPDAPRELAPHLPKELEAIILRLLEKDAGARFSSASEAAAELRGVAGLTAEHSAPAPSPAPPASTPASRSSVDPVRTTLASAASSTLSSPPDDTMAPYQSRRRRVLIIALSAAGVLALGGVGIGVLASRSAPAAERSQTPPPDARPATDEPTVTQLESPDAAPLSAGNPDAGPKRVTLAIDSEPRGATVYALPGRERVGETPLEHQASASAEGFAFALEKDGFRSERLELGADAEGEQVVELQRKRRPKRTRRQRQRRPRADQRREEAEAPGDAAERDGDDADTRESERKEQDGDRENDDGPLNPFNRDNRGDDEALNPFE